MINIFKYYKANAYCKKGNFYYFQEKYEEAINEYNKAIELNPYFPEAYCNRGGTYDFLEKYEEAIADCNKAIELKPYFPEAYCNRGYAYNDLGKHEEAIADCSKAIELKPDFSKAYNNRAYTYECWGKYEEAIADYNKAIELEPDYAEAYINRGSTYDFLEKYEEAIADCNKAIELMPNYAKAYNNRGNAYNSLGKYEEAIADYNKAIELKPDLANAYSNRGYTYDNLGKYEEAMADYNKAIELKPDCADAYYNKGNSYFSLKKYEEAINNYSKAIEIKSDFTMAYYNNAVTYLRKKDFINSEKNFKEYLKLKKDLSFISKKNRCQIIGKKYINAGNIAVAIDWFSLVQSDPIEILGFCKTLEQVETIASSLISNKDNNCRFNNIMASNNEPKLENFYKRIYIQILKTIYTLLIKGSDELSVAHYTTRGTASQLIIGKSPLRLNSVLTTNDPTEGDVLLEYLNINKIGTNSSDRENTPTEDYDFQAFINCFSFNEESLNQFRLYGKENSKEATGVSIVLKGNYFTTNMSLSILPSISKANRDKQKNDDEIDNIKYPIFRCLYIDPDKNEIVSIGSPDNEDTTNDLMIIKELLNAIKDEINRIGKENLDKNIIDNLFLTLRYLVKHSAFKEERECRMICIKDVKKDMKKEIHFTDDYLRMYTNYREISKDCINKIIFGPKAQRFDIFKEALAHEHIDCECKKSKLPFA